MAQTTRQNPPLKLRNPQPASDDLAVKREVPVQIRVTAEEKAAWEARAKDLDVSLSRFVRGAVNAALAKAAKAALKKGGR